MAADQTPPSLLGPACAAGLVVGALACVLLPVLPPVWLCVSAASAAAVAWVTRWRGRAMAALLFGLAWTGCHGHWALQAQMPAGTGVRNVMVHGRIVDLPRQGTGYTRFQFRVDACDDIPTLQGKRLQVVWHAPRRSDADGAMDQRQRLWAGAHWTLSLRVRPPRSRINPGGFDGERHALLRGEAGSASVRDIADNRELRPAHGLLAWRQRTSATIAAQIARPSARFIQALALGDTRGLSDTDWSQLRALGLTHLIAISGFHVGLVAGFAALLCSSLWRCWPALASRCPRPQAAACVAALAAAGYAVIAGSELPTVRTALMIAVVALARSARRPVPVVQGLSLAALAMLLPAPLSVLSAGFWLSFGGVLWLLWCLPQSQPKGVAAMLRAALAAQGVASVALLPLAVALFGGTARLGPLVNLPVIPLWSLLVVPLALLGTGLEVLHGGAGQWPWRAAAWLFELSWQPLQSVAEHPQAMWWLAQGPSWALPAALAGVFWWLLPRGAGAGIAGSLLCLPLLWPARSVPQQGEFELVVHDVGQGTAVLLRTAGHALWYDVGPPAGSGGDERILVPTLRALGQAAPQRVMISHDHLDHSGNLAAVRRQLPDLEVLAPPGAAIAGAVACQKGLRWQWDGVDFQVLHPSPPRDAGTGSGDNEASCVLRIAGAHGVALLPGDVGRQGEQALLQGAGSALRADVVLVPHHGSGGSSSPGWVRAVGARLALVSAGHHNRFGHPRRDVVQRWQAAGAEVLSTAESGAIRVWLGAQGLQLREQRIHSARWWDAAGRARSAAILSPIEQAAVGPEG
ncbi:MAG: DNA internalization-related competence protein ComEC/Rec2 [Stenotrophomonas sp.]